MSLLSQDLNVAPSAGTENGPAPAVVVVTEAAASTPNHKDSAPAPAQVTSEAGDRSTSTSPDPFVNVVMSKPKTTAELIAARALKRTERQTTVHEKAEGHKQAGELLSSQKNYKAACTHYQEASNLWASNIDYLIALAGVYRNLEWYEEAAHAATRALTLEPKNSEARYIRGIARLEQRLLVPAKVDFESVLKHEPDHLRARAALNEVNNVLDASTHLGTHTLGPNPADEIVKDVNFGFPRWEDDALELASLSDSSDAHHVGNGIQCRFYNHEGCARGSICTFSHAPDEKSVRDDLGKNVCTYFLLDMCKFGGTKCVYSHSKAALPQNKSGWWTSEEKIAKVKAVIELAEKNAREQRTLEKERWKEYVRSRKAAGASKNQHSKSQQQQKKEKENDKTEGAESVSAPQEDTAPASAKEELANPTATGENKSKRKPRASNGAGRRNRTQGQGRRGGTKAATAATPATEAAETVPGDVKAKVLVESQPTSAAVNGTDSAPHSEATRGVPAKATEEKAATSETAVEQKPTAVEEAKTPVDRRPSDEKPPASPTKIVPTASGPGFVDYELNVPPAGVKPIVHQTDDPITLPY